MPKNMGCGVVSSGLEPQLGYKLYIYSYVYQSALLSDNHKIPFSSTQHWGWISHSSRFLGHRDDLAPCVSFLDPGRRAISTWVMFSSTCDQKPRGRWNHVAIEGSLGIPRLRICTLTFARMSLAKANSWPDPASMGHGNKCYQWIFRKGNEYPLYNNSVHHHTT